jgi:hypothetical protein
MVTFGKVQRLGVMTYPDSRPSTHQVEVIQLVVVPEAFDKAMI